MKFYRVAHLCEGGCSAGYSWHSSKTEAKKESRKDVKDNPDQYKDEPPIILEVVSKPTKKNILSILKQYASYPDNG